MGKGPNLGIKNPDGTKLGSPKLSSDIIQSDDDDEDEETDSDDDDAPEEYDEDEGNSWDQPRSSANTPRDHRESTHDRQKERSSHLEYKRSESSACTSSNSSASTTCTSTDELRVGSRVEGRYRGGPKFYPGKISRVRLDGTFDIEYDDGECESRIGKLLIRVLPSRGGSQAVYKHAESTPTESFETPRETPRMQRPTPIAVKQSRYDHHNIT